ncbi:hypothetical protein GCM10010885_05490 [Alicyclobacillus cellulosilyticus]|uniref:Sporulation membrane protein YtrI C-terminal domain-containing protein n=1 Tax=Alicyclobacillus cellulosilyticus TaxID=1003997 RepID=A0A917NG79_9BACL|nr:hypothetical protein [Alicyclobacillus cellulosilyticus]GGI98876.1 hypothetical protein GCM10010885_05490 [Alicyclobacillus cellulosilyticus]
MRWTKAAALFAVGGLTGAAAMNTVASQRLNRLSLDLTELTMQYDGLLREYHNLIGIMDQPAQELRVQGIRVEASAPDTFAEVHAIQSVKHRLAFLIGYPVKSLDATILYQLVDGLPFRVDDTPYQVRVQAIVIAETLFVRVSVHEAKQV